MPETRRFALPLLAAGQAQKEVTHNEALLAIDRLLHPVVESRVLAMPPSAPAPGSAWLVAAGATGEWQGRDGRIAAHDGFGWTFFVPRTGTVAYVADEAAFVVLGVPAVASGWPVASLRIGAREVLGAPPETVAGPSGGALIDNECRSALNALLLALTRQGITL